jgi:short/branched chain acyl-CoA dehydrogenase
MKKNVINKLINSILIYSFAVARFAQEQIKPLVAKMDEEHKMDADLVKKLFENGFMGIEADPEYGGSGCNFLTMMIVVEEISKVICNIFLINSNY